MKCQKCGQDTFLPFRCPYCRNYFCADHRLPENHQCPEIGHTRTSKEKAQPPTVNAQTISLPAYPPFKAAKPHTAFSRKEATHLSIAATLVVGAGLTFPSTPYNDYLNLASLSALLAASFLLHEIAHKITAQRHGLWAEFRLTTMGLILTALSMIPSFIKIIGPGAVIISGSTDRKTIGKTSIIGPTTNLILASILCSTTFFLVRNWIFTVAAFYNAWIAIFNLIPIGVLDGSKVFHWNRKIWASAFTASLALGIVAYQLLWLA